RAQYRARTALHADGPFALQERAAGRPPERAIASRVLQRHQPASTAAGAQRERPGAGHLRTVLQHLREDGGFWDVAPTPVRRAVSVLGRTSVVGTTTIMMWADILKQAFGARGLMALVTVLVCGRSAHALNVALDVNQY